MLLIEESSLEKARAHVERLPLAAAGMLEVVSVIPLKPYAASGRETLKKSYIIQPSIS
ncbi:MAG: hypothetical protein WDN72_03495 [Alphaproteobacteria bacterium]